MSLSQATCKKIKFKNEGGNGVYTLMKGGGWWKVQSRSNNLDTLGGVTFKGQQKGSGNLREPVHS